MSPRSADRLINTCRLFISALFALSNPATSCRFLMSLFFCRGATAEPPAMHAIQTSISLQPVSEPSSPRNSSYHTANDDPDNEGGDYPPSPTVPPGSFPEPEPGRVLHTSLDLLGRINLRGRAPNAENPADTGRDSLTSSSMQRVRTAVSSLFVPERRVGKAPGIVCQLRTIVFGSCVSSSITCLWAYPTF